MAAKKPRGKENTGTTRRTFLKRAGAATVAATVGPTILHATDKAGSKSPVLGKGSFQYEVVSHAWGELPDHIVWGRRTEWRSTRRDSSTSSTAATRPGRWMRLSSLIPKGNTLRRSARNITTGGTGSTSARKETKQFLYLSDIAHGIVAKTTLTGEHVWVKGIPQEPGVYKGKAKYSPTNVAFGPDGGFYIGDGYGSHYIHQYDNQAKWVRTWGGFGDAPAR